MCDCVCAHSLRSACLFGPNKPDLASLHEVRPGLRVDSLHDGLAPVYERDGATLEVRIRAVDRGMFRLHHKARTAQQNGRPRLRPNRVELRKVSPPAVFAKVKYTGDSPVTVTIVKNTGYNRLHLPTGSILKGTSTHVKLPVLGSSATTLRFNLGAQILAELQAYKHGVLFVTLQAHSCNRDPTTPPPEMQPGRADCHRDTGLPAQQVFIQQVHSCILYSARTLGKHGNVNVTRDTDGTWMCNTQHFNQAQIQKSGKRHGRVIGLSHACCCA